jgi:hypothetical protein
MKKLLAIMVILGALSIGWGQVGGNFAAPRGATAGSEQIADAFRDHQSGIQVTGEGVVSNVLSDDNDGRRHQRFILRLASGQTQLVAHNIDLAPRIASLETGDTVAFNGVYEWNSKGGVIHWTHHDPRGEHQAGWLEHDGRTYQ